MVKEIPKLNQFNRIPGLTHTTIAGALQDGHSEVSEFELHRLNYSCNLLVLANSQDIAEDTF